MKTLVVFLIFISTCTGFSQDTNIIKYFPLKVGNEWIYNYRVNQYLKLTITGTTVINGHLYYVFEQSGVTCSCPYAVTPFLIALQPIRVDSISGNIMVSGNSCPGHNGEFVLDSLYEKIGDLPDSPCVTSRCYDTNQINIFGSVRKTKTLSYFNPYVFSRSYASGIGIYGSSGQCTMTLNCIYSLVGCVINNVVYGDTSFLVGINKISSEVPQSYSLYQNYPNPFNPTTKIRFDVPNAGNGRDGSLQIKIYDAVGREVTTLVNQQLQPGTYEVEWDATNYSSGVYFYRIAIHSDKLEAGNFSQTKKLVLIK